MEQSKGHIASEKNDLIAGKSKVFYFEGAADEQV